MSKIQEIVDSKIKPKEKTMRLAKAIKDKNLLDEVVEIFPNLGDPEKGTVLSGITEISRKDPQFVAPLLNFLIDHINYKANRVKWEAAESVGNLAKVDPEKAVSAIPNFKKLAKDPGTVIRWSAAYGLTEIAKVNLEARVKLMPFFKQQIASEKNNGVKNVYVKALKIMEKGA